MGGGVEGGWRVGGGWVGGRGVEVGVGWRAGALFSYAFSFGLESPDSPQKWNCQMGIGPLLVQKRPPG